MRDPKQSRGYRNRNPGNIDWNPRNKWQGQVGREATGSPPRFAVFESHGYGIRALVSLLTTYQDRHALRTIEGIISRWAPGNENDTEAYIEHVARLTGFDRKDRLDLHTYEHAAPLVKAIITHELGGDPYTPAEIDEGLRLAGLRKPVETLRDAAATQEGRGAVAAVTATGGAAAAVQVLGGVGTLDWRVAIVLILVAAAGVGVFLLSRKRKAEKTPPVATVHDDDAYLMKNPTAFLDLPDGRS
jgi:hypothetical protein